MPMSHPGAEAVPAADTSVRHLTMPPQAPPPAEPQEELLPSYPFGAYQQHQASQPAATAMSTIRPAKARLTSELTGALAAYREGATTARGLADALKAQGMRCEKDKAASFIKRLRELGEIP